MMNEDQIEELDDISEQTLRKFFQRARGGSVATVPNAESETSHLSLGTLLHFKEARLSTEERTAAVHHLASCSACRDRLTRTVRAAHAAEAFWEQMPQTQTAPVAPQPGLRKWVFDLVIHRQFAGAGAAGHKKETEYPVRYESPDGTFRMVVNAMNGRLVLSVDKQGVDPSGEVVFVATEPVEEGEPETDERDGIFVALEPTGGGWGSGSVILGDLDRLENMLIDTPVQVNPREVLLLKVRMLRDSIQNTLDGESVWKPWCAALPNEVRALLEQELSW